MWSSLVIRRMQLACCIHKILFTLIYRHLYHLDSILSSYIFFVAAAAVLSSNTTLLMLVRRSSSMSANSPLESSSEKAMKYQNGMYSISIQTSNDIRRVPIDYFVSLDPFDFIRINSFMFIHPYGVACTRRKSIHSAIIHLINLHQNVYSLFLLSLSLRFLYLSWNLSFNPSFYLFFYLSFYQTDECVDVFFFFARILNCLLYRGKHIKNGFESCR